MNEEEYKKISSIGSAWLMNNTKLWRNGEEDENFIVLLTNDIPEEVKIYVENLNAGLRETEELVIKKNLF